MRGESAPYSLVPSEEGSLLAECHQEKVPRGWSQEKVQGPKEQGGKVYKRRWKINHNIHSLQKTQRTCICKDIVLINLFYCIPFECSSILTLEPRTLKYAVDWHHCLGLMVYQSTWPTVKTTNHLITQTQCSQDWSKTQLSLNDTLTYNMFKLGRWSFPWILLSFINFQFKQILDWLIGTKFTAM